MQTIKSHPIKPAQLSATEAKRTAAHSGHTDTSSMSMGGYMDDLEDYQEREAVSLLRNQVQRTGRLRSFDY